jgi:predicted metallo-beta-lactamase superfamily hydrolase
VKVSILGAESLGVRSFCTFVETKDVKIIIDPGCALGTDRFNLPPHKLEIEKLWETWSKINNALQDADVVILTHYHYDHHHYRNVNLYKNKVVILKDFSHINQRQKSRAEILFNRIKDFSKVMIADSNSFQFGNTRISFSAPLGHGYGKEEIKIVAVFVEDKTQTMLFSSDVSGAIDVEFIDFLMGKRIDTFIFDGFPIYLLNAGLKKKWLENSKEKLLYILEHSKIKEFIIDHHSARCEDWKNYYKEIFEINFLNFAGTAAEYMGSNPQYLEAKRKLLFSGE